MWPMKLQRTTSCGSGMSVEGRLVEDHLFKGELPAGAPNILCDFLRSSP